VCRRTRSFASLPGGVCNGFVNAWRVIYCRDVAFRARDGMVKYFRWGY
jgi:hypothetical protein